MDVMEQIGQGALNLGGNVLQGAEQAGGALLGGAEQAGGALVGGAEALGKELAGGVGDLGRLLGLGGPAQPGVGTGVSGNQGNLAAVASSGAAPSPVPVAPPSGAGALTASDPVVADGLHMSDMPLGHDLNAPASGGGLNWYGSMGAPASGGAPAPSPSSDIGLGRADIGVTPGSSMPLADIGKQIAGLTTVPTSTDPLHQALNAISKTPLQAAGYGLEGASILKDVLSGQPPQEKQLKALQSQLQAQGNMQQNLGNAAQTGQLPQQMQSALDQQLNQQIAQIKQRYAEAGMSGSASEASDIAAARTASLGQQFAMGQSLAQQGFAQAQQDFASAGDYLAKIMELDAAQGSALGNDIGKLAEMLVGGAAKPQDKKPATA